MKRIEQLDLSWLSGETWVTSDQHWSHRNIRKYQHRPMNHFGLMRRQWMMTVKEEDTLLCLGDMIVYPFEEDYSHWIEGLPGKKYILLGNHDEKEYRTYQKNGWTLLGRDPFWWTYNDKTICFSHEHMRETDIYGHFRNDWDQWDINIHGHIHGNPWWSGTPVLDYRNVSVEVTEYAPVRIKDVIDGTAGRHYLSSIV